MKLLQLDQLGKAVRELKGSFNGLPVTEHKDGKYRLRRYSVIKLRTSFWNAEEEAEIERLEHRTFEQSEDYNQHQGGMARDFEEIEDSVLQSDGMKEICLTFRQAFDLTDGQEIEIHQMRVITEEDGIAKVSPEGVHQDGYDYIAMVGIGRFNVHGGELLLYNDKKATPFMNRALKDGEMAMVRDDRLWHNASPIVANGGRDRGRETNKGHADWFILCARK